MSFSFFGGQRYKKKPGLMVEIMFWTLCADVGAGFVGVNLSFEEDNIVELKWQLMVDRKSNSSNG